MGDQGFKKKLLAIKEKEVSTRLMQEVAAEMGIPLAQVKEAVINGQSKFTAHIMRSNTFDGVRWPYLGKFTAKAKAAQILKHMKGLNPIQKEFFFAQKEFRSWKNKFVKTKKKKDGK